MHRPSRRRLLGALGAVALATVAGCIGGTPDGTDDPDNATDSTTSDATSPSSPTDTPVTTTDEPPNWTHAADEVDYDHDVRIENADDVDHAVELRIVDVTADAAAVAHEDTYEVPAGGDRRTVMPAFDFSTLDDQERRRRFEVRARLSADSEWETVTIRMDGCHGNVVVAIGDDGDLDVVYSIC